MNSQIMYDLTGNNLHRLLIPHDPFAIGGYLNGAVTKYVWTADQWKSFPRSYHVKINVTGELGIGNCLDVENGDATPANVEPWINSQLTIKDPLLVYCNRSNLDAVLAARATTNWHHRVWIWIATLDGTVITDRALTQFSQFKDSQGAYADVSVIHNQELLNAMTKRIGLQH